MCKECDWTSKQAAHWIDLLYAPYIGQSCLVFSEELQAEGIAEMTLSGWQNFKQTRGVNRMKAENITHWKPL